MDALCASVRFGRGGRVPRRSLLFVYDGASDRTLLRMIDLVRTAENEPGDDGAPRRLLHNVPWVDGNNEEGYLTGVDNMLAIFEALLEAE